MKAKENSKRKENKFRDTTYLLLTENANNALRDACSLFDEEFYQFAVHLYNGTLVNSKKADGWTPVPYTFRKQFYPNVTIEMIAQVEFIQIWEYSREKKRCNRFRLDPEFMRMMTAIELEDLNNGAALINAVTHRKVNSVKSNFYDHTRNAIPNIVADHIRSYKASKFNKERGMHFLKDEKSNVDKLKRQLGESDPNYLKALRRHLNNVSCMKSVVACKTVHLGNGIWAYLPPYETQNSGRLTHIGGGFQNASRDFQAALFADIENYFNMDMVASQPNGVIQQLKLAGLDASWLETYRDTEKAKVKYSEQAGLSVDTWKDCLNATLMGTDVFAPNANLYKRFKYLWKVDKEKRPALLKYIYEEADGKAEKAYQLYIKFYKVIEPLRAVLKDWHSWLVDVYVPENQKPGKQGNFYLTNACEMKLYVTELKDGEIKKVNRRELKKTIPAWLLQGQEARFMAELAKLGSKYGYEFKQNFHDGCIVEGVIPLEAQEEAAALSGTLNARLEEKRFVNPYQKEEEAELKKALEELNEWGDPAEDYDPLKEYVELYDWERTLEYYL